MTIEDITLVKEMVDDCKGTSMQVVTVYEYENAYNGNIMYAVFTLACYNDIYESPAVVHPVKIYEFGIWLGAYEYLNRQ